MRSVMFAVRISESKPSDKRTCQRLVAAAKLEEESQPSGKSQTLEYRRWHKAKMIRATDDPRFADYGARGLHNGTCLG